MHGSQLLHVNGIFSGLEEFAVILSILIVILIYDINIESKCRHHLVDLRQGNEEHFGYNGR